MTPSLLLSRVLRISSDRDDRMGAKIKTKQKSLGLHTIPPNIPEPKFNRPENPMPTFQATKIARKQRLLQNKFGFTWLTELRGRAYAGTWPPKSLLISSYPKECLPFLPKKVPKSKISNSKKSFNYPCHLESKVPSWVLLKLPITINTILIFEGTWPWLFKRWIVLSNG